MTIAMDDVERMRDLKTDICSFSELISLTGKSV